MNVPTKLGAFAAALAVVFTIAFGVGRAVGPIGDDAPRHGSGEHPSAPTTDSTAPPTGDHRPGGH